MISFAVYSTLRTLVYRSFTGSAGIVGRISLSAEARKQKCITVSQAELELQALTCSLPPLEHEH